VYNSPPFKAIYDNVVGAFAHLGITHEDNLAAEFSRQVLWLHVHYPHIAEKPFANHLALCFDNIVLRPQLTASLRRLDRVRRIGVVPLHVARRTVYHPDGLPGYPDRSARSCRQPGR
jgi:hypothetical protein